MAKGPACIPQVHFPLFYIILIHLCDPSTERKQSKTKRDRSSFRSEERVNSCFVVTFSNTIGHAKTFVMQTLVWGLGHLYKFIYLTGLGNMSHVWVVPREWFALKCIGKWRSEGLNFSNRAWNRANLAWKVGSHFLLFANVKWSDAEGTFRCCWQTRATSYMSCQNPTDPQLHRI